MCHFVSRKLDAKIRNIVSKVPRLVALRDQHPPAGTVSDLIVATPLQKAVSGRLSPSIAELSLSNERTNSGMLCLALIPPSLFSSQPRDRSHPKPKARLLVRFPARKLPPVVHEEKVR
jgi:hypothetical protein